MARARTNVYVDTTLSIIIPGLLPIYPEASLGLRMSDWQQWITSKMANLAFALARPEGPVRAGFSPPVVHRNPRRTSRPLDCPHRISSSAYSPAFGYFIKPVQQHRRTFGGRLWQTPPSYEVGLTIASARWRIDVKAPLRRFPSVGTVWCHAIRHIARLATALLGVRSGLRANSSTAT